MDKYFWQKLAREKQISAVELIREEKEILILNYLSQSSIGNKIVFKGGTALRLVYGSPRCSQDLDFTQIENIDFHEFNKVIMQAEKQIPEIKAVDRHDKRNTLFSLFQVRTSAAKQIFTIKIEISKKEHNLKKNDYLPMTAKSEIIPIAPILYTYTLDRIFFEKKLAIKSRQQPRDYFDLWWLGQKMNRQIKFPKPKVNRSQFVGQINQLLPSHLKNWARDFLRQYE